MAEAGQHTRKSFFGNALTRLKGPNADPMLKWVKVAATPADT
jgi:hypothetical protein